MGRSARTALVLICLVAAATLAGCGKKGSPLPGEIDVRSLDVGHYAVDRHHYDASASGKGPLLEGMRMSSAVVPSVRVDPSLIVGEGGRVVVDARDATGHLLAGVSLPTLNADKMVVGYVSAGADQPDAPGTDGPGPSATAVTDLVMRFPDAATARKAAHDLEDVDFNVAPDLNRKLNLAAYPDALIHYRPGVANIGTFMARKEFVISLFVQRPTADPNDLLAWVKKTLDAEVPVLDRFEATPQNQLDGLPVDPDGLLARAVVRDRADHTPDPDQFAVYGPSTLVEIAADESVRQRLVDDTGLESLGIADGTSVLRVRDADAAARMIQGLIASAGSEYDAADAPKSVPGAKCLQLNGAGDVAHESKYRCYIPYRRYVEVISANDSADAQQRVAAAYALLANNF